MLSWKNVLFCFPCVLFGCNATWTNIGMNGLKHINKKVKHKHGGSIKHTKNFIVLILLENYTLCISYATYRQQKNTIRKWGEIRKFSHKLLTVWSFADYLNFSSMVTMKSQSWWDFKNSHQILVYFKNCRNLLEG